jgi:hypothetical protein
MQSINVASLSVGTPDSVQQSEVTVPISIVGCAVYTPAKKTYPVYTGLNATNVTDGNSTHQVLNVVMAHQRLQQQQDQHDTQGSGPMGANCVSPLHFWKNCIHREPEQQNGRCAVVNKLPAGPLTPFFPQPGVKHNRHYKGVMGKPTNTGNRPVDMWFKAAQTLVATQMNEMSGVVLPQNVVDAVSLVGSVLGTTSTTPPTLNMQLSGLASAINLLEMFNSGQVGSPAGVSFASGRHTGCAPACGVALTVCSELPVTALINQQGIHSRSTPVCDTLVGTVTDPGLFLPCCCCCLRFVALRRLVLSPARRYRGRGWHAWSDAAAV